MDTNNETEVRLFSINLYRYSLGYLEEIRMIELNQLGKLRYFYLHDPQIDDLL